MAGKIERISLVDNGVVTDVNLVVGDSKGRAWYGLEFVTSEGFTKMIFPERAETFMIRKLVEEAQTK